MLHSKNLISKKGQESYNTQVRQINVMQKEEASELRDLYIEQKERYDRLNEAKMELASSVAYLEQTIDCLDAFIAGFKNLAKV